MLQDSTAKGRKSTDERSKTKDELQAVFSRVQREQPARELIASELNIEVDLVFIESIEVNTLNLQTPNAAVANILRMNTHSLLNRLHQEALLPAEVTQLQIHVRPILNRKPVKHKNPEKLNQENAKLLSEVAESIDNPKLSKILARLSQYTKHS